MAQKFDARHGLTVNNGQTIAINADGTLATGMSGGTLGSLLVQSAPGATTFVAPAALNNVLLSGGVGAAPTYGKVGLTTHVSGVLPVLNGGTGTTTSTGSGSTVLNVSPTFSQSIILDGGVQTASLPFINSSQTWNAAGTSFTGIKVNITDTASAAGSMLMDLQVDGITKFKVDKFGNITGNDFVINGNLVVNGTTTTINTAELNVDDINITLGAVATPTDTTATGGGITLLGTTNKTITWSSANGWTSSEIINVVTGKDYRINGASVLSATTLGAGVVNSSLTSVGTITTGVWNGSIIGGQYGGTGVNNAGKTITLGGNLVTSGAFPLTLTVTAATSVTLPTTGTLATRAGVETFTNKTMSGALNTFTNIPNNALVNSTISGVQLGGTLGTLNVGKSTKTYNGSGNVSFSLLDIGATSKVEHIENSGTGVIVPFYQYPANVYTNVDVLRLRDVIQSNPSVPFLVVLNPASGPGSLVDGNYSALIEIMKAAGASVLGYVATTYAGKTVAAVKAEIDTWTSLYPGIDGIFLDEMNNAAPSTDIPYYTELTAYAHSVGYYPVVSNPGTPVLASYYAASDIICYIESAGYQTEATLAQFYVGGSGLVIDPAQKAAITYGVALDSAQIALMKKHAGWLYVTDQPFATVYSALPTDLETFVGMIVNKPYFADRLWTARTINGTTFDGSANIITASWGTSRNITIGNTLKAVDGSADVSWSLAEIGASPLGHTHTFAELTAKPTTLAGYGITDAISNNPTDISNGDWNTATTTGYYMGSNVLNAPDANWWIGEVVANIPNVWVTQTIYSFTTDSSADTVLYRRDMNSGVWSAWYKLQISQQEQDARYALLGHNHDTVYSPLSHTHTSLTSLVGDGSVIVTDNGNAGWTGRIISRNATANRAAMFGVFANGAAGVFSHDYTLTTWNNLYLNTVDGSGGGSVVAPGGITLNANGTITGTYFSGNAENVTTPSGTYKYIGAWGVGRTAAGAILVNTSYRADIASSIDGYLVNSSTSMSYADLRVSGAKNGYYSLAFGANSTATPVMMFDGAGNGGLYYQNWPNWVFYHTTSNRVTDFRGTLRTNGMNVLASAGASFSSNGYMTFNNGLKLQWGSFPFQAPANNGAHTIINFPLAMSAVVGVYATLAVVTTVPNFWYDHTIQANAVSGSQARFALNAPNNGGYGTTYTVQWFTIGW